MDSPAADDLVATALAEIEEEERLSAILGVDLAPSDPRPEHGPSHYLPLDEWLRRSEEVHRYLETERRAEHAELRRR